MKLYWSPRSPFVRKVMVTAHEVGVAERIEKIHTLVSPNSFHAEMSSINPIGRIPALVTDEHGVLYDSAVICEYLDHTYGSARLFPRNSRRWTALRRHALADAILELAIQWFAERARSQSRNELLEAYRAKISSALDQIDREASTFDGADVDIGQITTGVALGYLDFRFADVEWRNGRESAAAWYDTFSQRRSMQSTKPHDELRAAG